jgi:glycosyltransferase involved in cell wall biosynthesis
MNVALLSAAAREANPYIDLLCGGLAEAGVGVTLVQEPGEDGLPAAARQADLIHLHWLELWGRPAYTSLAGLAGWGAPGRGLRRWIEPALNAAPVFDRRRQRFLERFFDALADYKARGGRLVYTVHNLAQHEGEGGAVEAAAMRRLLGLADGLHVHAAYMADEVERISSVPPIAVIPHGHYIDAYPNTISRAAARHALELPLTVNHSPLTVYLFLGLIRPYKGLDELLPAFRSLPHPNAALLIAGRPRPSDYAARLAAQAGEDPRVVLHPHFVPNDEVQGWMNAADAVALPYRQITTSGAAMLAWSFGKPVIAPALPAFVEPMSDAPFLGLLYDPADPAGLAEALRQAAQTDWQTKREPILAWVRQFGWPGIGQQLARLYQRTMNDER